MTQPIANSPVPGAHVLSSGAHTPYEPPVLVVHGSIERWTQGVIGAATDGLVAAGSVAQRHSRSTP